MIGKSATATARVNEILAEGMQRRVKRVKAPPPELPSYSMGEPRVDLADRDALEDALERPHSLG